METNKIYHLLEREEALIVVDTRILMNNQISLGAKGLLLELLALKEDKVFIDNFTKRNLNSTSEVEMYVLELKNAGYLDVLC